VVAEGDDLPALRARLAEAARQAVATSGHALERSGMTSWDLDGLPAVLDVGEGAHAARVYPALVDETSSVAVRLLATPAEQSREMRRGTARLVLLSLPSPQRIVRPWLDERARALIRIGPYDGADEWVDDCLLSAAGRVIDDAGGPAWDRAGFERLVGAARDDLAEVADGVAERSLAALGELDRVQVLLGSAQERFPDVVRDVVDQVNGFVYPGFLAAVGPDRVADVARYLAGAAHRLERLPERIERDAELMARVHALQQQLDRFADAVGMTPELIEAAWLIEELRISFFAQHLGTRVKVSERRVERALEEAVL